MYRSSQPRVYCSRHVGNASCRGLSLLAAMLAAVLLSGCPRSKGASSNAYGVIPTAETAGAKLDRFLIPGSDLDKDGVTDDRERGMRSNPDDADTDKDGFADGFEDRFADFGFRIAGPDADRDADGLTDAHEKKIGSDPGKVDSDADAYSDLDEELNRHYGFDPVVKTLDTDFDGLSDALESRLGSSPTQADSNGDGIGDFQAYDADQPPNGPPLTYGLGELIGITYSQAMGEALLDMRKGGRWPRNCRTRRSPHASPAAASVPRRR
jgi:hypothetical protein